MLGFGKEIKREGKDGFGRAGIYSAVFVKIFMFVVSVQVY